MNKTFIAIATLIGTVIGAGILGIPYVVMKSGFGIGVATLILVAITITIIHLYLGEITLRTKENHQLAGYAEKYLGKKGKIVMFLAFSFGIYAALVAYLIGEGESFSYLFFGTSEYSIYLGIAFWIILSLLTFIGMKALEDGEEIGVTLIFILIISITVLYCNKIDISNLTYNNPQFFFAPFGVILFAFLGFAAIPEIERILNREQDKKDTLKIIIIGNILIFFIYLIFAAIVLGSQGKATPPIATLALGKPFILLGIIAMFTSYLALSAALINMFQYDFKKSKNISWLYTISIPIIAFVLLSIFEDANFTKVLGIGGVISGGLIGALILMMVKNAKKLGDRKPEYKIPYSKILAGIIIALLSIGAVLEIFNSI